MASDRGIPKITSSKSWFASRQDFAAHGVEIIEKGFKQAKSGVFRVTALDGSDLVLLAPEHWLAICKKKDEEVAPARKEFFLCDLHGAPFEEPYLYRYLASRMPGFDKHLEVISEALDEGIASVLSEGFDYSHGDSRPVIMQPQILHVYSHVIWRVILGNNFSPEVVDIFESYSATLIPVMKALKAQRPIIARITAAFSSDVRKVNAQLERVTAFFTPLFEQCAQALEQGLDMSSVNNDWLEELVRMAPEEKRRDYKYLTNVLIGFAFTFVFSPGPSTTQIVYEFAFRPDYTKLVLEEANQVLGEQVDIWHFTRDSLRRLSLLDSFCKETHKHHPTAASNLMKKIHKTQTLPNGVVLPAGTIFEVVMTAAHLSNPGFDNPAKWNGRRYHELRQQMSNGLGANKYDWGTATRDDVNFGEQLALFLLPSIEVVQIPKNSQRGHPTPKLVWPKACMPVYPDPLRSLASLIETPSADMESLQASLCDRASKDPQSSTNYFIKLPNELVLEITNLCQARKALSRVNKQLRSLTIPYIFRRMRKWVNEDRLFDSLQVIEKNPTILSAVQHFSLSSDGPNRPASRWDFLDSASGPCPAAAPALLATVLHKMINLEELSLRLCYGNKTLSGPLRKELLNKNIVLASIRILTFGNTSTMNFVPSTFINLRVLSVTVKTSPKKTSGLQGASTKLQLEVLELKQDNWTTEDVEEIFELFPQVSKLLVDGELKNTRVSTLIPIFKQFNNMRYLALTTVPKVYPRPGLFDDRLLDEIDDLRETHPLKEDLVINAVELFQQCQQLETVCLKDVFDGHVFLPTRNGKEITVDDTVFTNEDGFTFGWPTLSTM
ncbi:Cytochrome P450 monooxygenase BOA4 [Colletotrichum siamense]|uniref:Cytochrome P450 monooxygenase BOA4 n=1 Tax=Colletotrichum siamense TaxID=690259 RepID=UPI001872219D|nr:Cytochrome P450 monooxygenase BOA4 [Colletotrichum siamense]KAF5492222.1 Cytochrome P450 monooxygenase BOA4 [Colletotrichum siamense]